MATPVLSVIVKVPEVTFTDAVNSSVPSKSIIANVCNCSTKLDYTDCALLSDSCIIVPFFDNTTKLFALFVEEVAEQLNQIAYFPAAGVMLNWSITMYVSDVVENIEDEVAL